MINLLKIAFIAYIAVAIYGQGIKDGKRVTSNTIPPVQKKYLIQN